MTTRLFSRWLAVATMVGAVVVMVAPANAADGNKACVLVTPADLEVVLGTTVTLSGGQMSGGKVEICSGQAMSLKVMLRLVTGLDPGRDRSGAKEKAGIEAVKKLGVQVDVKTFGPMVCVTMEPLAGKEQMGYNTTCTVSKDTALAGIEIAANNKNDMVSIEKLRPLAEKMAERF